MADTTEPEHPEGMQGDPAAEALPDDAKERYTEESLRALAERPAWLNANELLAYGVGSAIQEAASQLMLYSKQYHPEATTVELGRIVQGALFLSALVGWWRHPDRLHAVARSLSSSDLFDDRVNEWAEILSELVVEGSDKNTLRFRTLRQAYAVQEARQAKRARNS